VSAGAWWDLFLAEQGGLDQMETWLGGVDAPSRIRLRARIAECGYRSVLDCGAGLGFDWLGLGPNVAHPVRYLGVEPSTWMREASLLLAERFGHDEPPPLMDGSIEALPVGDGEFEFVYCRHVWEHLPRFEPALREMLRAAILEVAVVFFLRPAAQTYLTRERDGLWQNVWARHEIEAALYREEKYGTHFWQHLPGNESILHVYTAEALEAVEPDGVAGRLAVAAEAAEPEPERSNE